MKTCLLLLTGLLATAAARSPPQYPRPGCSPGKSTSDGCNTCTCLPSRVISCTEKYCPPPAATCQHGLNFIDQCENTCICMPGGWYACKPRGTPGGGVCYDGATAGEPMTCPVDGEIRIEAHSRFFCKGGIVKFGLTNNPDSCKPGSSWKEACNTCRCLADGFRRACTRRACSSHLDQGRPILGGGGSGQYRPEIAEKRYCDGPCPADCGELLDDSRQCYRCQCGPELQLGDVVVSIESPCPAGLREGPPSFATKVCLGQGCTPDATWKVNRGCSTCVCTKDGEPACTPCKRVATKSTVTCEGGRPRCPADCGRIYNAEKDCYDCPCGVGEEGDVSVPFDQPCPPGTGHRANGAFFKACGPLDSLPKGDTKICDSVDCPADCGTVRVSREEGCVYCQCGPELAPGDEVVPLDQECRPRLLPGPTQLTTKVCRAPTRQECVPYTTYNLNCDICICQDGVPACTARDCSLPKYGDLQACDAQYRECPADCGTAGSDNYCQFCQCGPRLDEGDIVINIGKECPTGFIVKEFQWATKTCSPAPGCQYGPAYIDECSNTCRCTGGGYACGRKGCGPGQTAGKPLSCGSTTELPRLFKMRVFCHEDIVKIQPSEESCVPCSAKFVTLGSSTKAKGTLHIFELGSDKLEAIKDVEKPHDLKCGTFGGSSLADRHLATGDSEGSLQTWDLERLSKPVFSVRAHQQMINTLDGVGGAGRQQGAPELVTGGRDGSVKVWDVRQEVPVAVMEPAEGEPRRDCWTVAFGNSYNAEERCVCAGYDNGDIKMFDLRAMKVRWESNVKNGVCCVQFDRRDIEMNKIVATTLESGVFVFDARTQHPERGLTCLRERAHKSTVWCARHLPQNREIFMTCGGSGSLNLWHYTYPAKRRERDAGGDFGVMGSLTQLQNGIVSSQPVSAFDWSPDKRGLCVCVAFDQTVRVLIVTKLQLY